ncbi:MAG: NusG domain II-containing protein [Firmicutes bacterium]|nr:NusG domain II-containing protein [Bacillota bacterium]
MKRLWEFMTFYDKVLIIFITVISIFFIIYPVFSVSNKVNKPNNNYVIVIQTADGKQQRINMSETYRQKPLILEAEGPIGTTIIEAHNGRVRVKEAPPDDPLRIDEKMGWIDKPGPTIICVPNKLSIWIEAVNNNALELDGVSW